MIPASSLTAEQVRPASSLYNRCWSINLLTLCCKAAVWHIWHESPGSLKATTRWANGQPLDDVRQSISVCDPSFVSWTVARLVRPLTAAFQPILHVESLAERVCQRVHSDWLMCLVDRRRRREGTDVMEISKRRKARVTDWPSRFSEEAFSVQPTF